MNKDYHYYDKHNATGRTTRMINDAIEQAQMGEYAIVYFNNSESQRYLSAVIKRLLDLVPSHRVLGDSAVADKYRVGTAGGSLSLAQMKEFDWAKMRNYGVRPEVITFVDHHVIEQAHPQMVAALYKYII